MATDPHQRLITADEFLRIDFGTDMKAELDNGVIRMMAGGTRAHARVQINLYSALREALRGSGCRPYGSDMAVRVHDGSVRYPDLTVDCARERPDTDTDLTLSDPRIIIEILSSSTRRIDQGVKLDEYRALPGVDTIAFVDPEGERLRVLQRTGPAAWSDVSYSQPATLDLPALGVAIPHSEIFARD